MKCTMRFNTSVFQHSCDSAIHAR
uniref:Uncharacterized protein n=1 Tax=Anopheles minimus TaxID=112268 RepID=A0A182WMP8_9DIPT